MSGLVGGSAVVHGRPGRQRAPADRGELPVTSTGRHHAADPAGDTVVASAEEMIIGIAVGARYLGYPQA